MRTLTKSVDVGAHVQSLGYYSKDNKLVIGADNLKVKYMLYEICERN